MKTRKLGNTGENLSAIGLGCMPLSPVYGHSDQKEGIQLLHEALELGVNFWDTADRYGNGQNEELIAQALSGKRDQVFLATKFGFRIDEHGKHAGPQPDMYFDGSPAWMRQAIENSLKRLKVDHIDLYYSHRVDPNIPIEETVGAMAELVKEGKVRYLGLSEASSESLRRAQAVHPIAALQSEYSVLSRDVEQDILATARELQVSLIPFSPLARGLFNTIQQVNTLEEGDQRKTFPRFQAANLENNIKLAETWNAFAQDKGVSGTQLALAWVLAQGEDIIPIPGTKRSKYLRENIDAVAIELSHTDLQHIDSILAAYPNTGERYPSEMLKMVNN